MKKKVWIIAIVIILALAGGGYWYYSSTQAKAAAKKSQYQTVKVAPTTLTATVGSNGNVRARQSAVVTWQIGGKVGPIKTEIGDKVKAGEELAALDADELNQSILEAQNNLISAKIALDDLYKNADVNKAQAISDLVAAQDEVDDATRNRNIYSRTTVGSRDAIDSYYSTYILAKERQATAQEIFNAVSGKAVDDPDRAAALQSLSSANDAVTSAWINYNYYQSPPSAKEIETADARLALAKSKLEAAKVAVDDLKDGPSANDILLAQGKIDAIEKNLSQAKLTAPFSGTITDIISTQGDLVAAGAEAFRIDDLSVLLVDLQISEVDIDRIQVGQDVNITFDAISDQTYHGVVDKVGMVGEISNGTTNFVVTVKMTDADSHVKTGMTAAADIVVTKLENVFTVPNQSVQIINEKQTVYVQQSDGTLKSVEIKLGSASDADSEVTEGLKEGDEVVINPPTGNPFGMMMGGGGGRP